MPARKQAKGRQPAQGPGQVWPKGPARPNSGAADQLRLAEIFRSPKLTAQYKRLVPEYGVEAAIEAVLSGRRKRRK